MLLKLRRVLREAAVEEHAQVLGCCLEALVVLHEQQGLEHTHAKRVGEVLLGSGDCAEHLALELVAQTLEHVIERHEVAPLDIAPVLKGDKNAMRGAQHVARARGDILTGEGLVIGKANKGVVEHRELVGNEWVGCLEVLFVCVDVVVLGAIRKVEQHLEVALVLVVELVERRQRLWLLIEQTLLHHRVCIVCRNLDEHLEAGLNLGKLAGGALIELSRDGRHLLLRDDRDPRAASALGVEVLGDVLQHLQQRDAVGDVLAHLVRKEVEAEARLLDAPLVDVFLAPRSKVLGRGMVVPLVVLEDVGRGALGLAGHTVVHKAHLVREDERIAHDRLPGDVRLLLDLGLEVIEQTGTIKVALEQRNVGLFLCIVATVLVEYLDERRKQALARVASLSVGLAAYVEQDGLGRRLLAGFLQRAEQELVVLDLGLNVVKRGLSAHDLVLDEVRENLEQVGLARAIEARDPGAVA